MLRQINHFLLYPVALFLLLFLFLLSLNYKEMAKQLKSYLDESCKSFINFPERRETFAIIFSKL